MSSRFPTSSGPGDGRLRVARGELALALRPPRRGAAVVAFSVIVSASLRYGGHLSGAVYTGFQHCSRSGGNQLSNPTLESLSREFVCGISLATDVSDNSVSPSNLLPTL